MFVVSTRAFARTAQACGRLRVQVRWASTEEEILGLLGSGNKIEVSEVALQLNLPAPELERAMAALESSNKLYRYRRRGQWDVLIKSPEVIVEKILQEHSPAALVQQLGQLQKDLRAHKQTLANLDAIKSKIDEVARRHPDHFAGAGVVGMVGLWGLLFWMVFGEAVFGGETFVFDWNLVEPITYFLGYSIVWFGVVFYYFTGMGITCAARPLIHHRETHNKLRGNLPHSITTTTRNYLMCAERFIA
ncbi:hypothetical protein DIPPA_27866 [Diplonema papillatum]|nr:hypothetical protein DIPPA_27866 [Diplonema papillatum]